MRAVAIERFGGPEELRATEVDDPLVGPDYVLIRVAAAGVNPVDTKTRIGRQAERFPHLWPAIMGWDAAGTVERTGPAVTEFATGEPVLSYCRKDFIGRDAYAELVAVRVTQVASAEGLDPVQAGGLPLAGLTAYQAIHDKAALGPGDVVAIRGATGGVGTFAVQLARIAGARVVAIASAAHEDYARDLGAEDFVDYRDDDPVEGVLRLHPGGVDALLDFAGGEDLGRFAQTVKPEGRAVTILVPQAPEPFAERGVAWHYVFVRPSAEQLSGLVALVTRGELRIEVDGTFALEDAYAAHARLEGGGVRGKVVLTV